MAIPLPVLDQTRISGVLEAIRWRQESYVIAVLADGTTIKGDLYAPQIGMAYEFEGEWDHHPRFGRQFSFTSYRASYPTSPAAIRKYLEENCRSIGLILSRRIVETFGAETLSVCKVDPERVAREVKGITPERAREVAAALEAIEVEENLSLALADIFEGLPVPRRAISEIRSRWKHTAPDRIRENPFVLVEEIDGIGFATADRVAARVGFAREGTPRLRAGILHALTDAASSQGHVCMPEDALVSRAAELLEVEKDLVGLQVEAMAESGDLVRGPGGHVYLPELARDERLIADKIRILLGADVQPGRSFLEGLAPDQVEAVEKACSKSVFILTGAPGTGKTYTISRILSSFPDSTVALAAPTGKAAKRITEQTGRPARTIHRLLEPVPPGGSVEKVQCQECGHEWERLEPPAFSRGECEECGSEALEQKSTLPRESKFRFLRDHDSQITEDLVVVDEVSMIDTWLMARLVDAIRPGTRLILVGDTNQLPSVGPGNVLGDLIESGAVPSGELTIIKRQNPGLIVTNCHRIKAGEGIEVSNEIDSDFFFLERPSEDEIRDTILDLVAERLPASYKADPLRDIQVITPLREKTDLGCRALNGVLQERLNPGPFPVERTVFKPGDKVLNTRNDYENGVMNGDLGYVQAVTKNRIVVEFEDPSRTVELPLKKNDLELGYAITCHKFQGSEARIVVVPVHPCFGHLVMQRNWLYTAVSRAREVCVLVGQAGEIPKIVRRNQQERRWTGLAERLRGD